MIRNLRDLREKYSVPYLVMETLRNPQRAARIAKQQFVVRPHDRLEKIHENPSRVLERVPDTLGSVFSVDPERLSTYLSEVATDELLDERLEVASETVANKPYSLGSMDIEGRIVYALIRHFEPTCVVEVGVANGVSSLYLLRALERNGRGHLTSIDQPRYETDHTGDWASTAGAWVPTGKEAGWVVPASLRDRWTFRIGDMYDELEPALSERGPLDFFLYDGPKAVEHRLWALETALSHARSGTILACDDTVFNDAFETCCLEHGLEHVVCGNAGFARVSG